MKDNPLRKAKAPPCNKEVIWNTRCKDGWNKYKENTENNKKLIKTAELDTSNPEEILKAIEKELNKVKHKSFGKVKACSKPKE